MRCKACQGLNLDHIQEGLSKTPEDQWGNREFVIEIAENPLALQQSAQDGCECCRFFSLALSVGGGEGVLSYTSGPAVELLFWRGSDKDQGKRTSLTWGSCHVILETEDYNGPEAVVVPIAETWTDALVRAKI